MSLLLILYVHMHVQLVCELSIAVKSIPNGTPLHVCMIRPGPYLLTFLAVIVLAIMPIICTHTCTDARDSQHFFIETRH